MKTYTNLIFPRWAIAWCIMLSMTISVQGQDDPAIQLKGRWSEGQCNAIAGNGHIAYYGNGAMLEIVNFNNPENPVLLSSMVLEGSIQGLARNGNTIFAVGWKGYLNCIDITDPGNPFITGYLDLPGAIDIELSGNYAYISAEYFGMIIVDISVLEQPVLLSTTDTNFDVQSISISGDYAYAATSDGIVVIDISSKITPVVIREISLGGLVRGMDIKDTLLFVPALDQGLKIYSIKNPALPEWISTVYPIEAAEDVLFYNGYVFLAGRYNGVYILDISDPALPVEIKRVNTSRAISLAASHQFIYVSDTWNMTVIDMLDIPNAKVIARRDVGDQINGMTANTSHIFIAQNYFGMTTLDASDIQHPTVASYFHESNEANDVALRDTFAFLASRGNGLLVIGIGTPSNPYLVKTIELEAYALFITLYEDYAYVIMSNGGIAVLNISDPANTTYLGNFYPSFDSYKLFADDGLLWVCMGLDGMEIFDLSNPGVPSQLGFYYSGAWIMDVVVRGQFAYLANGGRGLLVLDISNPSTPVYKADYDLPGFSNNIGLMGNYACITSRDQGVYMLDISDPNAIELAAQNHFGTSLVGLALDQDKIIVADQNDGIFIFKFDSLAVSVPASPTAETEKPMVVTQVKPNPFGHRIYIEYNIKEPVEAKFTIYNATGQLIEVLINSHHQTGLYTATWDVSDTGITPGIYFLHASAGKQNQVVGLIHIPE
jgi:hypothetical protein